MMDFTHPHFAEPFWLWLAVAAPVGLALLHRHAATARRRQLAQVASPRFVEALTRSHSPLRRRIKQVLLLLAVACVGLALARPQWGELHSTDQGLGEDLVFVLDCSRSMLAADVPPDRLQRARLAIQDFVQRYGRGRVGLVAFAGSAFLQCPLTMDYDAFERALRAVDERTIPVPGTDIGRALREAYRGMDRQSRRKLVVLVTDGEDLEKTGVTTAESLATNGVVVFTVGVGSPAGTEIRYRDQAGNLQLVHDAQGNVVRSRLDGETLRAIAQATGGQYYPLGPLGEGLARVRSAVAELDRSAESARTLTRGVERFHVPVAAALVLITVESLITTRRRKRPLNE
jgi:Ca-activated chloride channel homolog